MCIEKRWWKTKTSSNIQSTKTRKAPSFFQQNSKNQPSSHSTGCLGHHRIIHQTWRHFRFGILFVSEFSTQVEGIDLPWNLYQKHLSHLWNFMAFHICYRVSWTVNLYKLGWNLLRIQLSNLHWQSKYRHFKGRHPYDFRLLCIPKWSCDHELWFQISIHCLFVAGKQQWEHGEHNIMGVSHN